MNKFYLLLFSLFSILNFSAQGELFLQTGHGSEISHLEFDQSNTYIGSLGKENYILIWDIKTGLIFSKLEWHGGNIENFAFHPNKNEILSINTDSTIVVWDFLNEKPLSSHKISYGIPTSISTDTDGKKIYICVSGRLITLEYPTFRIINERTDNFYYRVFTNKKGHLTLTGEISSPEWIAIPHDSTARTSYPILAKSGFCLAGENTLDYYSGSVSGNGVNKYKLVGSTQYIAVSNVQENTARFKINAIAAQGKYYAVATEKKNIYVYKKRGNRKVFNLIGHYSNPNCVAISKNEKWLASGDEDGNIFLWELEKGNLAYVMQSAIKKIQDAVVDQNGKTLYLIQNDGNLKIINLETFEVSSVKLNKSQFNYLQSSKFFVNRIISHTDTTLAFKLYEVRKRPNKTIRKVFVHVITLNKITQQLKYSISKTINFFDLSERIDDFLYHYKELFVTEKFSLLDETKMVYERDSSVYKIGEKAAQLSSKKLNLKIDIYTNGKVSIYNTNNQKRIQAFFPLDREYILYNDSNYYYCSKPLLPFIVLRENNTLLDYETFDISNNRPDIILNDLGYFPEAKINAARIALNKRTQLQGKQVTTSKDNQTHFELTTTDNQTVSSNRYKFVIKSDNNFSNTDRILILINGVPFPNLEGTKVKEDANQSEIPVEISLEKGKNLIQVSTVNKNSIKSPSKTFIVINNSEYVNKPNLYIAAIGSSQFKDSLFNLTYASKDASDISEQFKKSRIFKEIFPLVIVNEQISDKTPRAVFKWAENAQPDDVFILFYAGHGILDEKLNYYLSTYYVNFQKPDQQGINMDTLNSYINKIPCRKKLIFLDACHSGEIDKEEIVKTEQPIALQNTNIKFRAVQSGFMVSLDSTRQTSSIELTKMLFADTRLNDGINIISSAGAVEYAIEGGNWKNGVFTYALLDGLKKRKADLNKDGEIWISEIREYLTENVKTLTGGKQTPTSRTENINCNFRIW
jgi:WD40 repeat protein